MIDNESDVMKTFSDYSEEMPVEFIKLLIGKNHPWINKKIKDIELLPNVLTALIIRDGKQIIPKGDTLILENDIAVLSGPSLDEEPTGHLTEIKIEKDSECIGKNLSQIKFSQDKLVILIKRNGEAIIPSGKTIIEQDDVLIINQL